MSVYNCMRQKMNVCMSSGVWECECVTVSTHASFSIRTSVCVPTTRVSECVPVCVQSSRVCACTCAHLCMYTPHAVCVAICVYECLCVYTPHTVCVAICVCLCMSTSHAACVAICVCVSVCVHRAHSVLGSRTFAGLSVLPEAEALGTGAAVAARAVPAPAIVTQEAVEGTLVHVCRAGRKSGVRGPCTEAPRDTRLPAGHTHPCTPCRPRPPHSPGCRHSGSRPAGSRICRWHRCQGRGHTR